MKSDKFPSLDERYESLDVAGRKAREITIIIIHPTISAVTEKFTNEGSQVHKGNYNKGYFPMR